MQAPILSYMVRYVWGHTREDSTDGFPRQVRIQWSHKKRTTTNAQSRPPPRHSRDGMPENRNIIVQELVDDPSGICCIANPNHFGYDEGASSDMQTACSRIEG